MVQYRAVLPGSPLHGSTGTALFQGNTRTPEAEVFPALLEKRVLFAVQDKVLKGNKGW